MVLRKKLTEVKDIMETIRTEEFLVILIFCIYVLQKAFKLFEYIQKVV